MRPSWSESSRCIGGPCRALVLALAFAACVRQTGTAASTPGTAASTPGTAASTQAAAMSGGGATPDQLLLGRALVISHACGDCHGGGANPAAAGWLAGMRTPDQEFKIGPCAMDPNAKPCFRTRPRNLTPDNTTGLGRFTDRQIFNSLRYGLRPGETPDVEITSTTPGQGNFPANPKYLAPPMPWPSWRHMSDRELWAIAAYLKHGVKPVSNKVQDSEGPPDFWASEFTVAKIGPFPAPTYPTTNEVVRP